MNLSRPTVSFAAARVGRAGEAHAEPHVLLEVLGRRLRQDVLGLEAQLADRARRCGRAASDAVELREERRDPRSSPARSCTNFRFGKRSNTPDSIMKISGRRE